MSVAALMVAGTVMDVVGGLGEGDAAERQGERQKAYADYLARQMRVDAKQEVAASQRTAEEERRQADIVASRALAVAAASGGGASDPGVMRIISDIEAEGAYRSSIALYAGTEAARKLEEQAIATEMGGDIALEGGREAKRASRIGAVSSIISGGSSLYSKFGPKAIR